MGAKSAAILAVKILGDSKPAQAALKELDSSVTKAEATTKKSGAAMAGVWTAVAASIVKCTQSASQLEQATGAVNQIFGEMAPQVMEWAEGMSAYGLSTAQAAQAAATLGGAISSAGIPMEQTAVLTTELIELSADLVAVYGYSMPEALTAMGAALRGEYDSLEKFGIFLSADAVAAEQARLAAEGLTFESARQAQVVAVLSLIWQQSVPIQQAAEEEMNSMGATTARLKAEIGNLTAAIGGALIPVLQPLVDGLGKAIGALADTIAESELLKIATDLLAAAIEAIAPIIEAIVIPALEALNKIMDKVASFIDTYVMPIVDALAKAFDALAQAIEKVIGWVQDAIQAFENFIDVMLDAIDTLTFWNDTYEQSPNPSSVTPPEGAAMGVGTYGATGPQGRARQAPTVTINVQGPTDPYALARLLTRQLEAYAHIQGRPVGMPLAEAW